MFYNFSYKNLSYFFDTLSFERYNKFYSINSHNYITIKCKYRIKLLPPSFAFLNKFDLITSKMKPCTFNFIRQNSNLEKGVPAVVSFHPSPLARAATSTLALENYLSLLCIIYYFATAVQSAKKRTFRTAC